VPPGSLIVTRLETTILSYKIWTQPFHDPSWGAKDRLE
jgi:hypothetical protein